MSLVQQFSSLTGIRCIYSNRVMALRTTWSVRVSAHYLVEIKLRRCNPRGEKRAQPCTMIAWSHMRMGGIPIQPDVANEFGFQ